MTIQVDWAGAGATPGGVAYEIYVPKADLTLIQASPTEIRELDLNDFHIWLRDIEEDETGGRMWPTTHLHNGEVTVGGLTLARVISILDPYSVTFEDGQYAVNLVGANSNVGDKTNVNQVSVRPQNSAGLISSPLIEFDIFRGGVWVDVANGASGTTFSTSRPIGTPKLPVDNIPDAVLIAAYRGFETVYVIGDLELGSGDNVSGMILIGQSPIKSSISVLPAASVAGAEFRNCHLSGEMDGECSVTCCKLGDLTYVQGCIKECMLLGTVELTGSEASQFVKCFDGLPGVGIPIIDCGGSGRDVGVWGWHGGLKIINKTGPENISVNVDAGRVVVDSTVTDGAVLIKGAGLCEDNSTGTASVDTDGLNSPGAVWDLAEADHSGDGTMGYALGIVRMMQVNGLELADGDTDNWVLRDDAGQVKLRFNVTGPNGEPIALAAGYPALRSKGVAP